MQRREALRLLACAAALPLLSRDAFSLFQEVHDQLPASAALKTLSPEQNVMVTLISEIIIPQTDTPGAKEVRVNEFIDLILTEWYDHDERSLFLAGLADVNARSRAKFSADFADCPEPQQTQIVAELDEDLTRFRESLPVPPPDPAPQTVLRHDEAAYAGRLLHLGGRIRGRTARDNHPRRPCRLRTSRGSARKINMPANTYDAIVVGSGITGGWAAKELSEKGLRTLVLEAGRSITPENDYVEHVPASEMRFRGMGDRKRDSVDQPVQQISTGMDEWNSKFFVNDRENPYTTAPGKPFLWIRGRQVGGRSLIWGRQSYRWSDLDFEANLRESIAVDWPIRYQDIAPWYDHVEQFAGITGQAEGLPQLPDGKFLPPMEMTCAELVVKDAIAKHFPGERMMTIGRAAVLTQPHLGRAACHYCGPCSRGCSTLSYFSSVNATLPAAQKTGKVTIRPFSVVHSLIFDSKTRKVTGVRVIDGQTHAGARIPRPRCFPLRLHHRVGAYSAALRHSRIFHRTRQLQRRTGPQPDGPLHGQRRQRLYSGQ